MLSPRSLIADGRQRALAKHGTAWPEGTPTAELLTLFTEYREQCQANQVSAMADIKQRHIIDRTDGLMHLSHCLISLTDPPKFSSRRQGFVIKLPFWIRSLDNLVIEGEVFEQLRDFSVIDGHIAFHSGIKLPRSTQILAYGLIAYTGYLESFWANIFKYYDASPGSTRFYRAIHRAMQTTFSAVTLAELVAAAIGVEIVQQECEVIDILPGDGRMLAPTVVTTTGALHGKLADTVTVEKGARLYPSDTVFDSYRLIDCAANLPSWFTELQLPARLFTYQGPPVTITSVLQPAFGSSQQNGLTHLQVPVTGTPEAVSKFHSAMAAREQESGFTLVNYLLRKQSPTATEVTALLSKNFDWLEVLWSTWLRFGVSISVIRDQPSATALSRLGQVRRVVPPWLTHLIQLQQPDAINELC